MAPFTPLLTLWTPLSTALAAPLTGTETPEGSPDGSEEATLPDAPGREEVDSLTEALTRNIDNPVAEQIVERLIQPGLQILLILALAWLVLFVAKRLVARLITRAKDPDRRRGARPRRGDGEDSGASSLRAAQRADALGALLLSIVTVTVWVLAVFLILAELGLNLAPLVAGAGVIGLAIGFGAQDLVSDFLSGVFMLAEDQYGVGDIIDVGEAIGVVEGVTLRTTKVRDIEGTLWHVPNGEIRRVGNSSQQWARSLLDVSVAYQTDVDLAIEVIERVANAMAEEEGYRDQFMDHPEVWGVQALGPDSIDIRLVIKTQPGKQWAISRELRRRLKAACDATGIEIPYPQRTVWMRSDDDKSSVGVDSDHRADIDRAIATGRRGDRGADRVLAQDENLLAAEIEEEEEAAQDAEDAGATPSSEPR